MAQTVDLTEDLQQQVEQIRRQQPRGEMLERALLSMRDAIPYDLAAVYLLRGERLEVVAAVGPLASAEVRGHGLSLGEFPTIRRALETRHPAPLHEHEYAGTHREPYEGIVDLPSGHACMVIPLFAGDESLGIIMLDQRSVEPFAAALVDLGGVLGQLISVALAFERQSDRLDRYRRELELRNQYLVDETVPGSSAQALIEGSPSAAMSELARMARQVADSDMPVLLRGEPGTGKEVLGRAIHGWSRRADRPFVRVNCVAASEEALERDLFGYVEHAANGLIEERVGYLRLANLGTLLLDGVEAMSDRLQESLVQVLERGTFTPFGSSHAVAVDVRIIATSSQDLEAASRAGRFRKDLYFRLAAFPLELPPLRERLEDIPTISDRTLASFAARTGRGPWTLSPSARDLLARASWAGNVRELVNVLERAAIVQPRGVIEAAHLRPAPIIATAGAPADEPLLPLREAERRHLEAALRRCGGKIYGRDGSARLLDLKPTTLQSKLKKHGIDRLEVAAQGNGNGNGHGRELVPPSAREETHAAEPARQRLAGGSVAWPSARRD